LATSDDATDWWFDGFKEYDFSTGAPKAPKDAAKKQRSDEYTRLVWKASTKVGFGINGRFVVAWFCETEGNQPSTAAAFKENVPKNCLAGGLNTCFDAANRKVLDERRTWHGVTKATTKDDKAAVALQKLMDADKFFKDGTGAPTYWDGYVNDANSNKKVFLLKLKEAALPAPAAGAEDAYKAIKGKDPKCLAVAYKADAGQEVKLQSTGLAVEEWFKGEKFYDYTTNLEKKGNTAAQNTAALAFT